MNRVKNIKYSLYESKTQFYVVGFNSQEYKILKVKKLKTVEIIDDSITLSTPELLNLVHKGL